MADVRPFVGDISPDESPSNDAVFQFDRRSSGKRGIAFEVDRRQRRTVKHVRAGAVGKNFSLELRRCVRKHYTIRRGDHGEANLLVKREIAQHVLECGDIVGDDKLDAVFSNLPRACTPALRRAPSSSVSRSCRTMPLTNNAISSACIDATVEISCQRIEVFQNGRTAKSSGLYCLKIVASEARFILRHKFMHGHQCRLIDRHISVDILLRQRSPALGRFFQMK